MSHKEFKNLHILNHPLIQNKLTLMREESTPSALFRQLLKEIGMLMGYELTHNFPIEMKQIQTPLEKMNAPILTGPSPVIVPILRAGLGMADGLLELIPNAIEGHIGLYRDPDTCLPVEYLVKLPSDMNRDIIVVDPMLATGNSAVYALDVLIARGAPKDRIRFMALVGAPEGVRTFNKKYGDIPLYMASLDDGLNKKSYIVPGLGDAGDRLFGTK